MAKQDLHFIGFLVNVDSSIQDLKLGNGFSVSRKMQHEIGPLNQKLHYHFGASAGIDILDRGCCFYCIEKSFPSYVEGTPQGGICIPVAELMTICQEFQSRLKLLRLFKEGNLAAKYSLFYHLHDEVPSVVSLAEYPIADRTVLSLEKEELGLVEPFLNQSSVLFKHPYLQLAFDSFNQSYETGNLGLAFLSLMISLESLFSGERYELKYRVSRNIAVLLGNDEKTADDIFSDVKNLYEKRSALTHGSSNNITIKDLYVLRHYVRQSIKAIHKLNLGRRMLLDVINKRGFGQQL